MTPADHFRAAWTTARAAGYSCTKRAFADFVLRAPSLFPASLHRGAVAWWRENPESEVMTQRRFAGTHVLRGWTRTDDDGPLLRVVRTSGGGS